MAVSKTLLDTTGSGSRGIGATGIYGDGTSSTDNKATIKGAGYFNSLADELGNTTSLRIVASDATFDAKVSIASGVVTLSALDTFA